MNHTAFLHHIPLVLAPLLLATCEQKDPPNTTTPMGLAQASSSIIGLAQASSSILDDQRDPAERKEATPLDDDMLDASGKDAKTMEIDWKNQSMPPHTREAFEKKGKALLDAIVHDDVERARDFFFPREPFTPLKDAKEPDAYWQHLYRVYAQDVHKLHRRHKQWDNVQFEYVEPGTAPAWVAPGEEVNKIGYHRSWGTKLRYRLDGEVYTVRIHTVISWQDEWYITHLLPWKK